MESLGRIYCFIHLTGNYNLYMPLGYSIKKPGKTQRTIKPFKGILFCADEIIERSYKKLFIFIVIIN